MNQAPRKSTGPPLNPDRPVRSGKTGEGARSAMAQVALDRLSAAHTPEEQIKALWRLRVSEDRTIDGLWTLQTWLSENAPELLKDKGDGFQYLLALLSNEMTTGAGSG